MTSGVGRQVRPPRTPGARTASGQVRLLPVIAGCVLLGLLLRAPFLAGDLQSDEAGLLLVVRHWNPGESTVYGDYWVDRPPLLLGYFWLADLLPGVIGVRLLGLPVSVLLVSAAVVAGRSLGRRSGAWSAGVVAASLGSSYLLAGYQVNGMLQGAALVMTACAVAIAAFNRSGGAGRHLLWALSGALGLCAVLVKQNLVGGLVFALVLALASGWSLRASPRHSVLSVLTVVGGAAAAIGAMLGWATLTGVDRSQLWYSLYRFRLDAAEAISGASMAAPLERLGTLAASFAVSGLLFLVVLFLVSLPALWRDRSRRVYTAGVLAMSVEALVGITGGGSWWNNYLLQLVPAASLMAALCAGRRGRRTIAAAVAVACTVAASVCSVLVGIQIDREPRPQVLVARELAAVAEPGDTAFVAYGNAEILLYSGLDSDYPHLWSLPMRVLDPRQEALTAKLNGAHPPTWIVQIDSLNAWDVDADGELARAVERRYRPVATVCDLTVHLLRGVDRPAPPDAVCE